MAFRKRVGRRRKTFRKRKFTRRAKRFARKPRIGKSISPYSKGFSLKYSRTWSVNTYTTTYPVAGNFEPGDPPYQDNVPVEGGFLFSTTYIPTNFRTALFDMYDLVRLRGIKITYLNDDFDTSTSKASAGADVNSLTAMVLRFDPDDADLEDGPTILTNPKKRILKLSSSMRNPSYYIIPRGRGATDQDPRLYPVWMRTVSATIDSSKYYGIKYSTQFSGQQTASAKVAAIMLTYYWQFKTRSSN